MSGREYLSQLREAEIILMHKLQELRALAESRTMIKGQDYSIERVQTSPDGSGFTRDSDRQIDLTRKLADDIAAIEAKRHEIIEQIQSLSDIDYADVLFRRYIMEQDFKEIANAKRCSVSKVYHIHAEAIKEFEDKFSGVFCNILQRFTTHKSNQV